MACRPMFMTWECGGIGDSSVRASRSNDFGYHTLILDLKQIIEFSEHRFPNHSITLIGHSLGGQIASLFTAQYPDRVDDLILITACNVYYKGWENQMRVILAGRLFPLISSMLGYFPGHLFNFSGRETMTVMRDWASNALTGKYQLKGSSFNYDSALHKLEKRILAFSVENDQFKCQGLTKGQTIKGLTPTSTIVFKTITITFIVFLLSDLKYENN